MLAAENVTGLATIVRAALDEGNCLGARKSNSAVKP
jgi:hypothetical protein